MTFIRAFRQLQLPHSPVAITAAAFPLAFVLWSTSFASATEFRSFVMAEDFQSTRAYNFCVNNALKKFADELSPKVATKKNPDSFFNPAYLITKVELPAPLRDMGPIQVLTPSGIIQTKPEFFATRDGKLCQDFWVSLKAENGAKIAPVEFIAIDKPFASSAQLVLPDKISRDEKDFKKIASKALKSLTSKLSSKDRSTLKSLPMIGGSAQIKAEHVKYLPIKNKETRTWLIWLDGPWRDELSSKHGHTFSGAALVDASGKLISILEPLRIGGGEFSRSWSLEAITDLDGDGRQEILARHQGYEDGKIILHILSADNKTEPLTLREWNDLGD